MIRTLLILMTIACLVVALIWFFKTKSWEPMVAALGLIAYTYNFEEKEVKETTDPPSQGNSKGQRKD